MSLDASNVRVAVTGAVSVGDYGSPAPSGTGDTLTNAHVDLGYCDESGITMTFPGEGDVTSLKAWQNAAAVRTIRTASEDSPTISLVFLETKIEVVEFVLGVTVAQNSSEGSFEYKTKTRDPHSIVLDIVDGAELFRIYVPSGVVTETTDIEFVSDDAIKFGCTIGCDLDTSKDYNFKSWMTALSSP